MKEATKDRIFSKVACGHFNPPCMLAIKLGFDGLCISFGIRCLVGWIFNHVLKI